MSETTSKESCEPEEQSTDNRHSSKEKDYTPKKLSSGMKIILQEEIKNILRDVEEQLKDFAFLVKEVQSQAPSEWEVLMFSPLDTHSLPGATFTSSSSSSIPPPMRSIQTTDARPSNAALIDGFKIVRNLMAKLSYLINHVSLSTNADDEECVNVQSPHFEAYYSQYVFQIALFVLQIVGKKLTQLGEKLGESAIQELSEPMHVLDDNTRSHPAVFAILHHKDHKFCSSQLNSMSGQSTMMPSSSKIDCESAFPVTTSKHLISDLELRKCITDALGVLKCLSDKLHEKENPPYVCHDCRMNSVSASRIGCCDSCSALYGEMKTSSSNFLEDLIQKGRNSEDSRLKSPTEPSNQIVDDPKYAPASKSMPGVNFNIDLFSSLLKDEFKSIISQDSHERIEKPVQSDSIMILNRIIQCFREATENFDSGRKQFHDDFKDYGALMECSSGEADIEDNIAPDEEPQVKQTISTSEDEQFDEAVEKFVEGTYKLAAASIKRTRTCSNLALMSVSTSADLVGKGYECKGKDCDDDSHLVSVFSNDYSSSRDGRFQLSNFSEGQSLYHLFQKNPPTTNARGQVVLHCSEECYRGHILHQSHDYLPSGVMEIREINIYAELIVSLEEWIKEEDLVEEYELISSLMHMGLTRNEETTKILDVRKRLRTSNATSHLSLIDASIAKSVLPKNTKSRSSETIKKGTSDISKPTKMGFAAVEMPTLKKKGFKPLKDRNPVPSRNKAGIDKLWKFFDDLLTQNYCTGPPLLLRLRRNSILDDAFQTLMVSSRILLNYYRCIKIHLSEDDIFGRSNVEDGVDITDDFFPQIARDLFRPYNLSLFHYPSDESTHLYPNPTAPTHLEWFKFAGMILAFSFLYQKPLEVQFPRCFFKCLLDRPMNVHDLKEIDPLLYKKVMWLKETDITDRKNAFTFTVRERLGTIAYHAELVENGSNIEVTEENKQEYIEKCVKWKLAEQCLIQFQEIRRGFVSILNPKLLDRFKEEELQYMTEKALDTSSSEENLKGKVLLRRETL